VLSATPCVPFTRCAVLLLSIILVSCSGQPGSDLEDGEAGQVATAPSAFTQAMPVADSMSGWYALGMGAHHLCAGLWVVGRDFERSVVEVVAQDVTRFDVFHAEADFSWSVDESTSTATVSDPVYGSRSARYNNDQGCALLPAGAEQVYFDPVALTSSLPDPTTQAWPTGDLDATADFDEVDGVALEEALEFAFVDAGHGEQNTRGLVVVYRGKIIAERYRDGWGPHTPQISWSMGKSVAAALTGVLIQQGELELDDPAPIPAWHEGANDPRANIRIRDLLQMSSGLDFDNFGLTAAMPFLASNEHMRIYFDAMDAYTHAVNQPLRFEPGSVWRYRNSDPLSLMVAAKAIVEARGEDFLTFPHRALFDRVGMRSMVLETDPWGNFLVSGYDYGSTRDWARFGLLHLWDGVWEGERILPEGWSNFVSTPAPGDATQRYGAQFWINPSGALSQVPEDAYWAAGFMGQRTVVIPSRDMVIVRQGPSPAGFNAYFDDVMGRILGSVDSP